MSFILRKSAADPSLFEVLENQDVVKEIPIRFRLFKWPKRFISVEEIERWVRSEEKKLAKKAAYRLLEAKNQSAGELQRKLQQRGFSEVVSVEIIEECKRFGYVCDADLTKGLIEKELRRGYGPHYIEKKLRFLGLDSAQVREIVNEEAQKAAIRKWAPKLKSPLAALQRRGFDMEIVLSLVEKFSL